MSGWYGESMPLRDCCFETDRLIVHDWSRLLTGGKAEELRNAFVVSLLTEAVTRDLPPDWPGPYDTDRAASWFVERQSESTVLLIVNRSDGRPVGLLILSEPETSFRPLDVRLGYLIDENDWGRGFATEVVAGIAEWCRTNGSIRSLVGGVADGNSASARILQKNGFFPHVKSTDHPIREVKYTLTFTTHRTCRHQQATAGSSHDPNWFHPSWLGTDETHVPPGYIETNARRGFRAPSR